MGLDWLRDDELEVAGVRFRVAFEGRSVRFDREHLLVFKPRYLVEECAALVDLVQPQRIVELGIHQGGSTAFLACYARPAKLVAIDLRPAASDAFERWRASEPGNPVRPYFGVDQADRAAVERILDSEFGAAPLDLVIDDASHEYGPTLESFETIFPRLRAGGWYVLEDWSGRLELEALIATDEAVQGRIRADISAGSVEISPVTEVPLAALALQLVVMSGSTRVIDEVHVRPNWCAVRRAPATRDLPAPFRVSDHLHGVAGALVRTTAGLG